MSRFTSLLRKNFVILFVLAAIFSFTSCEEPNVEVPLDKFNTPTITGKVCIPEGMDIEPSDVSIKVVSEGVTRKIEPVMEDGTYVIGGLEEGKKYTLCFSTEIQSPDNARALDAVPAAAAATTRGFGGWLDNLIPGTDKEHADCGNIYMKPLGTIKGKAVKKGAEDNFEIDVYIPGTSYIAKTAKDGSFAIYNVPQGTHTIRFASNGYIARMEEGVILSGPDYVTHPEKEMKTVELIKNVGTVSGKITLSGETSHEGIALTLEGNEDLPSRTMNTSSDGAYRISDVVPGTYSLLITKEGYITQKVNDITVKANKDTPVAEVILQKQNTTVTGTFKLNGMTDYTGIQVLMKAADGSDSSYPSSTDKDGKFVINNVRPGSYRITAFKENYANITVDIHVSTESGNDAGTYTLENATRSLSGFVNDKYGNPISGVDILATNIYDNKANFISRTNELGYYSLSGMVPGTYVISYSLDGYQNFKSGNISVERDVAHNMNDVVMTRANGDISGTLDFGSNSVPANITVILKNSSDIVVESAVVNTAEFRFNDIKPGAYTVTVSVEDYAIVSMPVAVRADDITSVSCMMTKSVGKLSGKITLSGASSYDGVIVKISNEKLGERVVSTGIEGDYVIDRIQPGTYELTVSKDGFITETKQIVISAGSAETFNAGLKKSTGSVFGTLDFGASTVPEKIAVTLSNAANAYSVVINEKAFNFTGCKPGIYTLTVTVEDYKTVTDTVEVKADTDTPVAYVMESSVGAMEGTVTLKDSATISNIIVSLKGAGLPERNVTVGSDGSYSIDRIQPGTYTLSISKEGYGTYETEVLIVAGKTERRDCTLNNSYGTIMGTVKLVGASDSSGITITARKSGVAAGSSITRNTDDKGLFVIDGIKEAGEYVLTVSKDNYASVNGIKVNVELGGTSVVDDISLKKISVNVTGTVTLKDGSDAAGIILSLDAVDGSVSKPGVTQANGYFIINDVMPGRYVLTMSKDGYKTLSSDSILIEESVDRNIGSYVLQEGTRSVTGTVSIAGLEDLSSISIVATDINDPNNKVPALTDSNGKYSLVNMKPGTYVIEISRMGYQTERVSDVSVETGSIAELPLVTLKRANGDVTGTLDFGSDSLPSNITVILKNSSDVVVESVVTDVAEFRFNEIKPGAYTLTVSVEDYSTVRMSVAVRAGEATPVSCLMTKSVGKLSGKITLCGASSYDGVIVKISNEKLGERFVPTDSDGNYVIDRIQPGTYELTVSKDGFITETKQIVISAGSAETFNAGLKKSTGSVTGTLDFGASTVPEKIAVTLSNAANTYSVVINETTFNFTGCKPGIYTLTVTVENYKTVTDTVEVKADVDIPVAYVMESAVGKLSGNITLSGESVFDRITVSITGDGLPARTVPVNEVGAYSIYRIVPGTYTVSVSRDGYVTYTETVYIGAGEEKTVSTELIKASGIITGRAILEGTADYAEINVIAGNINTGKTYSVSTDEQGIFNIYNVTEEGTYSLLISKDGYISDTTQTVEVRFNGTAVATPVTLKNVFASVSGIVKLGEGATPTGVSILLKEQIESNPASYPIITDSEGKYSIGKVKPGTYSLYVSHSGYESKTLTDIVIAESSDNTMLPVTLPVGIRSVTGKVNLELRSEHSGALVTATNTSDGSLVYSAITNTDGNYTLAGMKSGQYNIVITAADYNTVTLPTVDITEGALLDLGLTEVSITKGFITGMVDLEGRNNDSGVKVYLVGTDYVVETDAKGVYTFNVPAGNYPGGLRFEHDYYKVASHVDTLTVLKNSTFGVQEKKLTALYSDVSGKVIVEGTGNADGVSVTLAGQTVVTETDGVFSFSKVPVGMQAIKLERLNTPTIESEISVYPAESVVLDAYRMIPDSATIKGYVKLDGMATHEGVEIKLIERTTGRTYSTKSNTTGYFNISNVNTSGIYDVTFTKNGWESCAPVVLDNLKSLETRDITGAGLILKDTIAPIINKVIVNGGAPASSSSIVSVDIDAEEFGSGIEAMRITWDIDFSKSPWIVFEQHFMSDTKVQDNITKTIQIQIRDKAGNISEIIGKDSVQLTNQIRTVKGTLSGEDLHWVAARNPYVVTGDIYVMEGDTFIIDPGVDVRFNGNYSIIVKGKIKAIGECDNPIVFRSSKNSLPEGVEGYDGNWNSIQFNNVGLTVDDSVMPYKYIDGSILSHCKINDIQNGIIGNLFIEDCTIVSKGYALGSNKFFSGVAVGSKITGFIKINNCDSCNFGTLIFNNEFNGLNSEDSYTGFILAEGLLINNCIESYDNVIVGTSNSSCIRIRNNTFNNCSFGLGYNGYYNFCNDFYYNEISNLKSPIICSSGYPSTIINYCNFSDNIITPLLEGNKYGEYNPYYNLKNNYWGPEYTAELESSTSRNASFIHDCYDDPLLNEIDCSDNSKQAWSFAGYKGDDYREIVAVHDRRFYVPVGKDIAFELNSLGWDISEYRVVQTVEELVDLPWEPYRSIGIMDYSRLDVSRVDSSGYLTLFVQGRDVSGNESNLEILKVPYSAPKISNMNINGKIIRNDDIVNLSCNVTSPYGYVPNDVNYLEGYEGESLYSIDPTVMKNGQYTLIHESTDSLGQVSIEKAIFEIRRDIPEILNFTIENNVINNGDNLNVSLDLINTYHLKLVKFFVGDNLVATWKYSDNGDFTIKENGSFAYKYLPMGNVPVSIEIVDYAGNISKKIVGEITVFGTDVPPAISCTNIVEGQICSGNDTINPAIAVKDNGGVRNIKVLLNGKSIYDVSYSSYSKNLEEVVPNVKLEIPLLKNGEWTMSVIASDFAGNTSKLERHFSVDRPDITILNTFNETDNSYILEGTLTNAKYIYMLYVVVDDTVASGDYLLGRYPEDIPYHFEITKDSLPLGKHEIAIACIDRAGNYYTIPAISIDVPGEIDVCYGIGKTWNENGTLMKDDFTRMLLNFDDPDKPGNDVVGGRNIIKRIVSSNLCPGLGRYGVGNNIFMSDVDIQLYDGSWTLEFWSRCNSFDDDWNELVRIFPLFEWKFYQVSSEETARIYLDLNYASDSSPNSLAWHTKEHYLLSRDELASWHHYAITFDGMTIRAFVDGMEFCSVDNVKTLDRMEEIQFILDGDKYIDEFRISDKARSQNEIFDYVQYVKKLKNW